MYKVLLLILLCSSSLVRAEDPTFVPPDAVQVSTPQYQLSAKEFTPATGLYTYEVSWQGIPAASVSLRVTRDGEYYRVITLAKTYRAIDLFYRLRYRAEGLISRESFQPHMALIDHRENSRIKNTRVTFHENGDIESIRSQVGKETSVLRFNSSNFTLDPFSAAFMARGLEWTKGAVKEFDTFNGRARYLITLTAKDKIKMNVGGEEREVWVISPIVRNLSTPEQSKKLREAKIYLTADDKREIVRITSSVFVGNVTTTLREFTPDEEYQERLHVAQAPEKEIHQRAG